MARAARRAAQTGRVIPTSILRETVRAVPGAVENVAPLADYCVCIDNSGGDDPAQTASTASFRESECQERSVTEGEGEGDNACSEATGTLPEGFPVLATPGETWDSFRRMFAPDGGGC